MIKFNKKFYGHQGDIQFYSIDSIPSSFKKVTKTFFAKSEKSGHIHALSGDYDLYVDDNSPDAFIIDVKEGCSVLNHTNSSMVDERYWDEMKVTEKADHFSTFFNPGVYIVGIQRRKRPFSKIWEKVRD